MERDQQNGRPSGTIVVGGGLAGLTAAATLARQGGPVKLVEQAKHLGGRAATSVKQEVCLNLGAHALYCGGEAFHTLRELGVPFRGGYPSQGRGQLPQLRHQPQPALAPCNTPHHLRTQ